MYQGHVRKGITKIVALLLVLSLFVGQVGMTGQTAFASQSEPAISSTGFSWCLVDESGNETQMVAQLLLLPVALRPWCWFMAPSLTRRGGPA
jgi:hypothetical protein